jgi:hypothetical protein
MSVRTGLATNSAERIASSAPQRMRATHGTYVVFLLTGPGIVFASSSGSSSDGG